MPGIGQDRSSPNRWLSNCIIDEAASCRLLCFNSAGAGATLFRQWDRQSSRALNVVGLQLPGRENRFAEPPLRDVHELVEQVGPALLELLDRPYALFGHSYGSLLAFEVARWLRRQGLPAPRHLFVAGRPAPQLPHRFRKTYDLPEQEFIDILRRYGGTKESILGNLPAIRQFLPTIRADLEANTLYAYREEPPLECDITAMRGDTDALCEEDELLAWREQTAHRFQYLFFEGGHFFHTEESEQLLRHVEAALDNTAPHPTRLEPGNG
ncbi:MAG TPA: alpha/beta fold hydrolase [Myxococcaceae bacterium]|nr:alpha/beta fold hydrolase [Myxococcaceae bacterium]